MATIKKSVGPLRGAALVKKAIEAAKGTSVIDAPEPVSVAILKKLRLPNDEKISPAMKELLAFDSGWLGWSFDDEEPEFDTMSLEDVVEQELGAEHVAAFGEAYELFPEECILIQAGGEDTRRCLYVGASDDAGEYPVLTLRAEGGAWIGGFAPFDVWVAQQLGALERGKEPGFVPPEYEPFAKALAEANGDGRLHFQPEAGEGEGEDQDEDEEESDSD